MCARFSLVAPVAEIETFLDARFEYELPQRANVAPSLEIPALVETKHGRAIKMLRWGLVPHWAQDISTSNRLVNARAETALEKPAFREAFRQRRCVIPANGFYEWKEEAEDCFEFSEPTLFGDDPPRKKAGKKIKQPYFFHRADGQLLGMAGLWERWKDPAGQWLETCAILTTEPNRTLAEFHDRMPCILERGDFALWVSPEENPEALAPLLQSLPDEEIAFERADPRLNNVRYEPYAA